VSGGRSRWKSAEKAGRIGAVVGAIAGFAAGEDCSGEEFICFPRPATAFAGASLGVLVGGVIGFVGGRADKWRDHKLPRVSIVPTTSGALRVSSTLRF
jgi:hypothetical protein